MLSGKIEPADLAVRTHGADCELADLLIREPAKVAAARPETKIAAVANGPRVINQTKGRSRSMPPA